MKRGLKSYPGHSPEKAGSSRLAGPYYQESWVAYPNFSQSERRNEEERKKKGGEPFCIHLTSWKGKVSSRKGSSEKEKAVKIRSNSKS